MVKPPTILFFEGLIAPNVLCTQKSKGSLRRGHFQNCCLQEKRLLRILLDAQTAHQSRVFPTDSLKTTQIFVVFVVVFVDVVFGFDVGSGGFAILGKGFANQNWTNRQTLEIS